MLRNGVKPKVIAAQMGLSVDIVQRMVKWHRATELAFLELWACLKFQSVCFRVFTDFWMSVVPWKPSWEDTRPLFERIAGLFGAGCNISVSKDVISDSLQCQGLGWKQVWCHQYYYCPSTDCFVQLTHNAWRYKGWVSDWDCRNFHSWAAGLCRWICMQQIHSSMKIWLGTCLYPSTMERCTYSRNQVGYLLLSAFHATVKLDSKSYQPYHWVVSVLTSAWTGEEFCSFIDFIDVLLDNMSTYPGCNSVIIMDNASIHHSDGLWGFVEAWYVLTNQIDDLNSFCSGMHLVYLPPYSPNLNPIEQGFLSMKAWTMMMWQENCLWMRVNYQPVIYISLFRMLYMSWWHQKTFAVGFLTEAILYN